METFLPMRNFPDYVILEYTSGGAELALALPEGARPYCIAAARLYKAGRSRAARDLFLLILRDFVTERLACNLRKFTVPELAELAAYLLNVKHSVKENPEISISDAALDRAIDRLLRKSCVQGT